MMWSSPILCLMTIVMTFVHFLQFWLCKRLSHSNNNNNVAIFAVAQPGEKKTWTNNNDLLILIMPTHCAQYFFFFFWQKKSDLSISNDQKNAPISPLKNRACFQKFLHNCYFWMNAHLMQCFHFNMISEQNWVKMKALFLLAESYELLCINASVNDGYSFLQCQCPLFS